MSNSVSQADRTRLIETIQKHCFLDADLTAEMVADDIIASAGVRDFGFGSLIKGHHETSGIIRYDAQVADYICGYNCAFRFYGGTHEYPSLMLGAEKKQGGILPGVVTEKPLRDENDNFSIDRAIDFLEKFVKRENPPGNQIYRLKFMQVRPTEKIRTPVLAVMCETDPDGMQYIGDALTLHEKAILIASEWGSQVELDTQGKIDDSRNRSTFRKTIYNYMIEIIDSRLVKDFSLDGAVTGDELMELSRLTNYYRSQMNPEKKQLLETFESNMLDQTPEEINAELDGLLKTQEPGMPSVFRRAHQNRRNLDSRVFEKADLPDIPPQEYSRRLQAARAKMREVLGMPPIDQTQKPMITLVTVQRSLEPLN